MSTYQPLLKARLAQTLYGMPVDLDDRNEGGHASERSLSIRTLTGLPKSA